MNGARYDACEILRKANHQEGAVCARHQACAVESCEITIAANQYVDDHPEIIAFATERYHDFVKRGVLRPERKPRKPSQ